MTILRKILAIVIALMGLGYGAFPIDIIPDVVIGLGQLDDLSLIVAAIYFAYKIWNDKKRPRISKPNHPKDTHKGRKVN